MIFRSRECETSAVCVCVSVSHVSVLRGLADSPFVFQMRPWLLWKPTSRTEVQPGQRCVLQDSV